MLIIKEMIENDLALKQVIQCDSTESMLRLMIADSGNVDVEELDAKIEGQRRATKKAIADYIKVHKEGLLGDVRSIKALTFDFNSVDMIDRINALENDVSYIQSQVISPYESLVEDLKQMRQKADEARLMGLLQDLGMYYEYGSDFVHISNPFILGK